ncbi:MAG: GTPase Era [Ignavibacteria bacterium RBG_13_36_8]|nr:MAG: GTPase Era [Ignavibacteria bacterium RBG_13_36_8]
MSTKAGFVSIIGKPNVGKSTLMNALLGQKLSIITSKPQTTRKRILGILSNENYQVIFLDTPGILKPEYLLQEKMLQYVFNSVRDADIILFIIDVRDNRLDTETLTDKQIGNILNKSKAKKILLLNKTDLVNDSEIKRALNEIELLHMFDKIIPISAITGHNLTLLLESIVELLPVHHKYFPDDQVTDETERFFVSEIIREKIFELFQEEIPYSTEVIIEEFKEREGRKDFISAVIIVERDTQKPIIIGKDGIKIKELGQIARKDIEYFLERPVYLELRVKVRNKWRSSPTMLKNFGYILRNE